MASLIKFAISGGESPKLIPLKALYFIHYMAFSTQTFLPMYFDFREHYTKFQIGILLALPCICTIIAPPAWGAAADILRSQKQIHVLCLISAALLMFSLQFVKSFEVMCIMFFIANFQTQPTWSLLDQVAMEMLDSIGGDYGKQRLYGAIGYGIGGYMSGVITAWIGIQWCFNMVLALSVFSLILLVYFLPASKHHQESVQFLSSLTYILKQRDILLLFILVLVIGVMAMVIDNFLFLYLFNLSGNNSKLIGIVIAVQTTSELPLFFHANPIIDAMGTPKCIFLGILAYTVRLLVYTFIQNPWMVLPIEVLHGITFGLVWAAFTNYVYNSAPAGTEGTMIGLLAALQKGAGGGIAALLGGWVYQTYGPRVMWASSFIVAVPLAVIIAAMFALFAKTYKSGSKQSPSTDFEAQPLKPRTPSYGSVHHFGSSGHLAELGR